MNENRKRDKKGKYINVIPGGWKVKQSEYQKIYLLKNPWAKHRIYSQSRAKKKGWKHELNTSDFKKLWERDEGNLLKRPSIDRIDSTKGYIKDNCRFIELSINSSLGNRYTNRTEKQRKASSENLKNYKKNNPIPWNKRSV